MTGNHHRTNAKCPDTTEGDYPANVLVWVDVDSPTFKRCWRTTASPSVRSIT